MVRITVGPVIGLVTDTTARVAIEIDTAADVTCLATDRYGNYVEASLSLKKDRFTAFELSDLEPDSRYTFSFEGAESPVSSSFHTLATTPERMNICAVSCNFTIFREETDCWRDLYDRNIKPGNIDLLVHIGDQIYGDSAFQEAESLLEGALVGSAAQQEQIRDLYRRLYRMTWRFPATRDVMANVPNLMIWDDHEIRDDWGSRAGDNNPATQAHHIGTLAQEVFREYQRQLWQSADDWPDNKFEGHFHKWGEIGLLFVDQRGGRTFEFDPARPYLGTEQWNQISTALSPGGYFDDVRGLVVVTSVPLVYLGDAITNGGSGLVDDLQDHWAYGTHRAEQVEMLRALRKWKAVGGRELLVVGGDVHIGVHTDIKHNNQTIFKQLITSPMTNKPPGFLGFKALKAMLELEESLTDSYAFEHSDYTRLRNYGMVLVRIPEDVTATPKVSGGLEKPHNQKNGG
ncbi:alkaline phosphatase D family protein [Kiloniella antarctica]|uniref:Alkaline phosphatase D family protein n=1 Tax=Kiloniella antarctica TaxID=1550907 RepID=A0ABW5BLM8_9PROT